MINGMMGAAVVVVETVNDPYTFSNECEQVIQYSTGTDTYYEVVSTFVDAYMYKAIIILKRGE